MFRVPARNRAPGRPFAHFHNRFLPVTPAVTVLSSLTIISQLVPIEKQYLLPIEKSGDRGCAGPARSEVGTLTALM